MISLALLAFYALAAGLLYAAYVTFYQYTYWKRRKIPHLELIPILGNNAPIFFRTVPFPVHSLNLYKRYPEASYYGFFDLRRPAVLVKDPNMIREVCIKNFDNFMDHEAFVSEEMDPITGRNLFSLKGQRWKNVRNTLSPSYTAARMKLLFELIAECSKEFIQYFLDNPQMAKEFECKAAFTKYTNDVIATAAFGVTVNSMKDEDNEFFMNGKVATSFKWHWIVKVTLMRLFPKFMRIMGATFLPKSAHEFFKNLIINTVKLREEKGTVRPDMIQLLMQAMNKNHDQVSMDDIIGSAFIFFIAGFETSSTLMSFIAHELSVNPDVQKKLQREIDEKFPEDSDEITYDSLSEMKYLDNVVSETLRLYPPASITNRVCVKDHKFPPPAEGYPECWIEKGTIIIMPIFGLHRDPKYFPEPEKFIPERFDDKDKINPYTYMPFGLGPRMCIGNRFALMETKVVIVHLLRKFTIRTSDKTQLPIKYSKRNFNLEVDGGVWISLEERKKTN